jgi:putative transcriptional regulator
MRSTAERLVGACLAAAVLLGTSWALAQDPDRGFLLVAKTSILDPNFARTVIAVARAPDGAALGVILNRPTKQSLADILPNRLGKFTDPLHFGGPVERAGLFAIFRASLGSERALVITEDVQLAVQPDVVEQLITQPPTQLRFFVGYAGWAPGQLEGEVRRGDWWVMSADADTIFRKDTATLWDELSRRAQSVTAELPAVSSALP